MGKHKSLILNTEKCQLCDIIFTHQYVKKQIFCSYEHKINLINQNFKDTATILNFYCLF